MEDLDIVRASESSTAAASLLVALVTGVCVAAQDVNYSDFVSSDDFEDGDYGSSLAWTREDGLWTVRRDGDNVWLRGNGPRARLRTPIRFSGRRPERLELEARIRFPGDRGTASFSLSDGARRNSLRCGSTR